MFEVTYYTVSSVKIPRSFDGYRIVQLSDLHSKVFKPDNQPLLAAVERAAPDLIVATGDMLNARGDSGRVFIELARELIKKAPVLYIGGNHETILERNGPNQFLRYHNALEKAGVTVMHDNVFEVARGADMLRIYGLNMPYLSYHPWFKKWYKGLRDPNVHDFERILGTAGREGYNVLLVHPPFFFEEYARWGADLVFTGHVHGGMIRLPLVGGVLSPNCTLFPKYDWGIFRSGNAQMIVNKGLGSSGKVRIFCRPEIVVATLRNGV